MFFFFGGFVRPRKAVMSVKKNPARKAVQRPEKVPRNSTGMHRVNRTSHMTCVRMTNVRLNTLDKMSR